MMDKSKYPKNWAGIRSTILERSRNRCECLGHCGIDHKRESDNNHTRTIDPELAKYLAFARFSRRCPERNNNKAIFARGKVVLTTAHLCHHTECENLDHLAAFCQRCHLRYDRFLHAVHSRNTRKAKIKQMDFYEFGKP